MIGKIACTLIKEKGASHKPSLLRFHVRVIGFLPLSWLGLDPPRGEVVSLTPWENKRRKFNRRAWGEFEEPATS